MTCQHYQKCRENPLPNRENTFYNQLKMSTFTVEKERNINPLKVKNYDIIISIYDRSIIRKVCSEGWFLRTSSPLSN